MVIRSKIVDINYKRNYMYEFTATGGSFLSLQVDESGLLSSSLLAEVYAPIQILNSLVPHPQCDWLPVQLQQDSCLHTHTAVGSVGWHTILCVWSHSIPLSGNGISCFMQLYKAVCILIHPLLPFHLFSSLFLLSLSPSPLSSQVSPTPPSQTLVFWLRLVC